ncbi:hypothetical protein DL96DRAFT_1733904 [Flagelloscypha sp. PMI_526]|nr:hypothetical protein DL96DRAFT_1733904 [Flagelloscypha sp. PMI_526]
MAAIPLNGDWYWDFLDNFKVSGVKVYKPNPTYLAWLEKASTFSARSIFVDQEQVLELQKRTSELLEKLAADKAQELIPRSPESSTAEKSDPPETPNVLNSDNNDKLKLRIAQEAEWDQITRTFKAAEALALLPELPIPERALSVDIVRYAFRFAACLDSREAKTLSLVSRDVQNWVDPFVFRYLAPKSIYEELYKTLKSGESPRLVQAKDGHFKGVTLLRDNGDGQLTRLIKAIPALRSLSSLAGILCTYNDANTAKVLRSRISRLHIDSWSPTLVSLADDLIASNNLTHLSLKVNTHDVGSLSQRWDWTPLQSLSKLTYFLLHTNPARFFRTNPENVTEYHALFTDKLRPVLPNTLRVLIWVLPPIIRRNEQVAGDLEPYKRLLDGTVISRMVVAFQRESGGTCVTSESAGAGHEAFAYPDAGVYPATGNEGLGWLESDLCERAVTFLKEREARKRQVGQILEYLKRIEYHDRFAGRNFYP